MASGTLYFSSSVRKSPEMEEAELRNNPKGMLKTCQGAQFRGNRVFLCDPCLFLCFHLFIYLFIFSSFLELGFAQGLALSM